MDCDVVDSTWGPWAGPNCRGGLDFTLTFEEAILTILPTGLMILGAVAQIVFLIGRPRVVANGFLMWVKQGLTIVLGLLKLAVIMLWAIPGTGGAPRTNLTLPAAAVNFVGVFPLSALSYFEHTLSVAPSFLIELYLLLTILFDVARLRTLGLMPEGSHRSLAAAEGVALAVKIALMLVEAARKDRLIAPEVKRKHTLEQLSGFYGRSMFFWLGATLWNGFTRYLVATDLSGPRDEESAELLRERFRATWAFNMSKTHPTANPPAKSALFTTLLTSMPTKFLGPVIPRLVIVALTLTQPMLLERLITFVQGGAVHPGEQSVIYSERSDVGYALIGAFAILYILMALFNAWYAHACNKLALEMRSVLIDSCYRQLLKMRLAALDAGKAATLINVDMQHIMEGSKILHDIWASLITVAVAVYLLFLKIQMAAPLGPRQVAWLAATEARVKSTMFMITGFKEVKMLGLSPAYTQNLQELRSTEVLLGRTAANKVAAASTELSILVAFGGFAIISNIQGIPLTFQTLFASLALLRISLDPLFLLIQGTPALVSMFKCLGRVQDLLYDDRLVDSEQLDHNGPHGGLGFSHPPNPYGHSSVSSTAELMKNAHQMMDPYQENFQQQEPGQEPGVPLLEVQEHHLQPHVSQHLHGHGHYRYNSGVDMTELVEILDASFCWKSKEDVPAMSVPALTIAPASFTAVIGPVGSGKSTLLKGILGEIEHISGSRQMRRGLRVAFCDQEPWLMDQSVRENIIGSRAFEPEWYARVIDACAMAPDIEGFAEGDEKNVGSGGSALSGGQKSRVALARAVYCRPELLLMDDIFSGLDRKSSTHIFTSVFAEDGLLSKLGCAAVLVTHSTQFLPRFNTILLINNATITHRGTYEELLASGALDESVLPHASSGSGSPTTAKPAASAGDSVEVTSDGKIVLKNAPLDTEETQASRAPSEWAVYGYFLKSCGVMGITLFFVLAGVLAGERSFETVWLKMWAEDPNPSLSYYIGVFTGLIVGGVSLLGGICVASITYVVSVGSHTIANRFIQDIMLVDDELPMALVNTTTSFFGVVAETIIVMISSKYVSASIPILILVLFVIQKFYLRTSKQLRLIDIEAKAPLSAFLLETLQGIVSIRAFDRTGEFSAKNTELLNFSQKAHYTLVSVQVWLKMILDFVVTLLAIMVTTLAVTLRSDQSLGWLGLALVNLISLSTSFKYLITFWANLETSIGAVARIRRFNLDVEPEEMFQLPPPHPAWPTEGGIEIERLTASYSPNTPPAINNINLKIEPGMKVAVCGRSGSGKSSLIATLLRCLELNSGTITIDGLDVSRLSRDAVRKRIMTLPQKSLFIHDSIRANMLMWDDSAAHASRTEAETDRLIETFLRKKKKKSKSDDGTEGKDKDDGPVTLSSPLNPEERLSIGQQQLFCLARGLFQRGDSQIVLMDEFTSSMDHETEALVRDIVERDLKGKTVIEVLHRLEHILDFDLVVVLEKGKIVEVGHPEELLQDEEGLLRDLYQSMRG
ncbi:P-loop containing nucleoside triphosphate hydrolase protein [Dichotomopilus funicola]|uniref:P-loop containing nucleoside triphosphate hydrolase protein n=1 Tax=Dichotomopilus funicola TaxID=1934379 RepID=A0AAN6UUC5_9PEZI|nr:P-loop containing nucleoside triphosphate hydrolase protein [Dichotomopilus funicola]